MTAPHEPTAAALPPSPWVLADDVTVNQTVNLLETIAQWLIEAPSEHGSHLAQVLSRGDTDTLGVATWIDALAGRLTRCVAGDEL